MSVDRKVVYEETKDLGNVIVWIFSLGQSQVQVERCYHLIRGLCEKKGFDPESEEGSILQDVKDTLCFVKSDMNP